MQMATVQLLSDIGDLAEALQQGSRGDQVLQLQNFLASAGFSPGALDSIYGSNTASAVAAIQRKLGLKADGIFGPDTKATIERDLASPNSVLRAGAKVISLRPPALTVTPQTTAIVPAGQPAPVPQGAVPAEVPVYQQSWFFPTLILGGGALLWYFMGKKGATAAGGTAGTPE